MYGRAEEAVGELPVRGLFLATKVWTTGRASGIAQMQRSMQRMRTDRLDLMQVHNLLDVDTHLPTLREWKAEGRIRFLGVTHYHAGAHEQLEQLIRRERIDFLQVNYSLAEPEAEARLLPAAMQLGVAVVINRPFAEGALLRRMRGRALPSFAAELDCTSWAQLFLKWIVAHPAVTAVIPATSDLAHLDEDLAAGFGRLPDSPMRRRIADAVRG
jgi:diketogulonate reductase-like aldo/keto reductase